MFYQSRQFAMIIYGKKNLEFVIEHLGLVNHKYAYILHDRDINEDGSPAMPHYHLWAERKSPVTNDTFKNMRKFTDENILWSNVRIKVQAIRYLTHRDNPDKYQYKTSEIECNFDYESACIEVVNRQRIDNAEIIDKLDKGWSVVSLIRANPSLLYSINQLKAYKELVDNEKLHNKCDWSHNIDKDKIIQLPVAEH